MVNMSSLKTSPSCRYDPSQRPETNNAVASIDSLSSDGDERFTTFEDYGRLVGRCGELSGRRGVPDGQHRQYGQCHQHRPTQCQRRADRNLWWRLTFCRNRR